MKSEQKQEFKSSGVLTLLGLVSFSGMIIAAPWNRQSLDSQADLALQKAEVVGYQVVQIYREAAKNSATPTVSSARVPASVGPEGGLDNVRTTGTMGTDPWGQPYHFRILSAEKSKAMRILVWSTGPNKKSDTPDLENESKKLLGQPVYNGDDLGMILSMAQH